MTLDYKADYLESLGTTVSENEEPVAEEKEEKIDYATDFLKKLLLLLTESLWNL